MTSEDAQGSLRRDRAMSRQRIVEDDSHRATGDDARRWLLAGAPVKERRLDLAGVSTAVLEAGDGPPGVLLPGQGGGGGVGRPGGRGARRPVGLLHGQGGWAGMWLPVVPELADGHHVVAPDLPGLGASEVPDGPPDAALVLRWLGGVMGGPR